MKELNWEQKKDELLKKLEKEFEESQTLQWFIEIEIKRLTNNEVDYKEIKKIAQLAQKILKDKKE